MAVEAPSGIVKWYNHNFAGPRSFAALKTMLTGKTQPGSSPRTSYVKLSDKEADEVIENIKKDPEGFPNFDEANAPDKAEEYQRWLVARYLTKVREEAFEKTQEKSTPPKPTSSALVPVGVKGTDLVEEEIDERILAILGIQDVFDFTYEEYATLLKGQAMSARMAQGSMPIESIELVTDEFKRVKNKTGKFKVKSKKVDINKIVNRTGQAGKTSVQLDPTKLLPPAIQESQDQQQEVQKDILDFLKNDLLDALRSINSVVTDILDVLKEQRAIDQKKAEQNRRESEVDKKRKTEAKLEGGERDSSSLLSNVAKPFTNFFDTIKNFFMNILMGSAINFLLAVLKNPSIILTPLTNFANMIIGFLNNIIGFLWNLVVSPINFVIGSINSGIRGLINQINNAIRLIPGAKPVTTPQLPTIPGPPQIPTLPVQGQEGGGQVISFGKTSSNGQVVNVGNISFDTGGQITNDSGIKIKGFGKDDRLIAAQKGEVMMSNAAGDFWGRDNLLAMNAVGGGTNKPKFGALNISAMQGGGMVGGFGRVMAPRTGGRNQWASQGARSVFQLFGLNVPGTERSATYSESDVSRYNKLNPTRNIRMGQGYESLSGGGYGLSPTIMTVPKNFASQRSSFVGDAFRNFGQNVKAVKGAASRQEAIMKQYGYTPDGYDTMFQRSPAVLEPQSRVLPPAPPSSKPNIIMMPLPGGKTAQVPTSSATSNQPHIPSFPSQDPMSMNGLAVKGMYNMAG